VSSLSQRKDQGDDGQLWHICENKSFTTGNIIFGLTKQLFIGVIAINNHADHAVNGTVWH